MDPGVYESDEFFRDQMLKKAHLLGIIIAGKKLEDIVLEITAREDELGILNDEARRIGIDPIDMSEYELANLIKRTNQHSDFLVGPVDEVKSSIAIIELILDNRGWASPAEIMKSLKMLKNYRLSIARKRAKGVQISEDENLLAVQISVIFKRIQELDEGHQLKVSLSEH